MPAYNAEVAQLQALLQEQGARWQAGITDLSALSTDEKRLHLGYVPGPEEPSLPEREQIARANLAASQAERTRAAGAPSSYDLRNVGGQNFITSIKDQGSCGSCVAFGTIATVEGTIRVSNNDPNLAVDYSEAHLFYCHARAQGRRCSGTSGGWWVPPALDAFKSPGVADDACYPYVSGDQACSNLCSDWENRVTKITAWHEITTPAEMKTWLSTRGPLAACFTVYDDFFSYVSGVYKHVSGPLRGGHCVCCVGYNDTDRYWICKNSWGPSWGENGFFRIEYGQVGIDSVMWAVDGIVAAEGAGIWHNSKKITGLWGSDQDRNGWAFVEGIGWKKIAANSDSVFLGLLIQLSTAKGADRKTNVYEEQGVIKQVYVF